MGKYNISKQFGIWAHFKPPRLTKFIAKIAQKFTGGMWRTLKRQKGIAFKLIEIQTGLKAFLISPADSSSRDCLVYFHGGGFVFDAAFSHYKLACEYARRCGINVLFVGYTLVPNRVYPVQQKECLAAINYAKQGFDKVIVGGDSAGGFLAATSLIQSINTGIRLDGAMLIYPVIDNKMRTKSMMEFCDTPMWDSINNKKMWQWYYHGVDYPVSLLDISLPNNLPPIYIETAQYDCLRDEALLFSQKIIAHGGKVYENQTQHTMHGFDVKDCQITRDAILNRVVFLKTLL